MRFISGVRHNLNLTADGGFDRIMSTGRLRGLRASLGSTTAHRAVATRYSTHHRDTAAGAGSAERAAALAHVGLIFTLTMGFAFYPLAGLVGHIRGGSMASKLGGTQRLIVAAGLFTTLGLPVYLLFLMITAANVIGPVVVGRTLPWLLLQDQPSLSASADIVIAAWWWRSRRHGDRTDDHRPMLRRGRGSPGLGGLLGFACAVTKVQSATGVSSPSSADWLAAGYRSAASMVGGLLDGELGHWVCLQAFIRDGHTAADRATIAAVFDLFQSPIERREPIPQAGGLRHRRRPVLPVAAPWIRRIAFGHMVICSSRAEIGQQPLHLRTLRLQ